MRQAAAELSTRVCEYRPHLIGLVEAHLDGEPLGGLLPQGYKLVNRLDRTKHGGGLIWLSQSHLLIDKVNMKQCNTKSVAEILGIKYMADTLQLCYTPHSSLAPNLVKCMPAIQRRLSKGASFIFR